MNRAGRHLYAAGLNGQTKPSLKQSCWPAKVTTKGVDKKGTEVVEHTEMAESRADFTKEDILARHHAIIEGFIGYLKRNNLIG